MQALPNKKRLLTQIALVWSIIIGLYTVTRYYQIKLNGSSSLPQKLWLVHVGDTDLHYGDYVVAKFHDYRMLNPVDYMFVIKQVGGMPYDQLYVESKSSTKMMSYTVGRMVSSYMIRDKEYPVYDMLSGYKFTPLTTTDMMIPNKCYFGHGTQQPTFDSRYKEFGLICESQIYGKAYPIFN